jgi:hypothetical protein
MTPKEMKDRTGRFSNRIIAFCTPLLENRGTNEIADQLLRSGTAVDANYGSAQRGRSNDEFIAGSGRCWTMRASLEGGSKSCMHPDWYR